MKTKQEKAEFENMMKVYRSRCREIKNEIENEERSTNFFQQERERVNYVWMIQKRKVEEAQGELLNKQKEREDLQEKHKIEEKLYFQKIKYLMLRHQDENVELQKDAEIALKQLEDSHRVKEKDFKYDIRSLSKMKKEQEVLQNDFINALEKDNIKALHQLKMDYELKECQIRGYYREKMREMKHNAIEKRNKIIEEITNKKTREIKKLTEDHTNSFNKMKNYYSDLNNKNLNKLKLLSDDLRKEIDLQNKLKNQKHSKMNTKRKIDEPLKKLREEIEMLLKKEALCKENFDLLKKQNMEYNGLMKSLLDIEYKYEVTLQKISFLEKEKNYLMDKYKNALHRVEQKSGLRNILLEKKLEILEDNLEIKEVQLKELIKKTSLDPNAIANLTSTLEDVELMKGETINQLEDELRRIKEAHHNMIKTYEAKLAEFGIPVEEMGFEPLIPIDMVKKIT